MSEEKTPGWDKASFATPAPIENASATPAASTPVQDAVVEDGTSSSDSDSSRIAPEMTNSTVGDNNNNDERAYRDQGQKTHPPPDEAEAERRSPLAHDTSRARDQDVLPEILGRQLRAAYGELLSTPLPDSITDLVKKLERRDPAPPQADSTRRSGKDSH